MALEDLTGNKYIDALNSANPVVADDFDKGVDHLQGIKNVLKKTFANLTGAVTATQADLNATSTLAADYAPYSRSRKNMIINGNFAIQQRDDSIIGISPNEFPADRWRYVGNHSAVLNTGPHSTASGSVPFYNGIIFDVTTADASVAAGDYAGMVYKAEGHDVAHLSIGAGTPKTVVLSFWHKHTKTGTYCVALRNSANDRSYVAEYTQSVTETWEKSEVAVTLDTTGTWLYGAGVGLSLHFTMMSGTTFQATADTWTAGNYFGTSNQVNAFDSTSNYCRWSNVQLELGDVATDFEKRTHVEELALCQRYCVWFPKNHAVAGAATTTTNARIVIPMPVQLRSGSPTLSSTLGDWRIRGGSSNHTPTAVSVNTSSNPNPAGISLDFTISGTMTQYRSHTGYNNNPLTIEDEL